MTNQGGGYGLGSIFKMNLDGTQATTLHAFTWNYSSNRGSDGQYPISAPLIIGSQLFGVSPGGGSFGGYGGVFRINTDGTGFTMVLPFDPNLPTATGTSPYASLINSGNILFGSTTIAVGSGTGTIFKVNVDGTGYSTLHTFSQLEGTRPEGHLTLVGSTLYGTATSGGANGFGAIFKVNTDGTNFAVLHSFTGADGADPETPLTLVGSTLYGMTSSDSLNSAGTIFKIDTDGNNFDVVHNFAADFSEGDNASNNGLTVIGSRLYGATAFGGTNGRGVLFSLNADGTDFSVLHDFGGGSDGQTPDSDLILVGSSLYGSTVNSSGFVAGGTVFSFAVAEPSATVLAILGLLNIAACRACSRFVIR